jgi:hypothetical protein
MQDNSFGGYYTEINYKEKLNELKKAYNRNKNTEKNKLSYMV